MLDAYAVRKAIPRVVLAVIGINLSVYLCLAAVDITTVVAESMTSLLVGPFAASGITVFGQPTDSANVIAAGAGAAVGAGTLYAASSSLIAALSAAGGLGPALMLLLFLLLPIVLLALAIMITVVLRQVILLFLIVASPVAIACYVLPGTEKYFQKWWDLFLKTLIVYPIIALIFALSDVFASILGSTNTGGVEGVAKTVTTIVVIYAPLFMIPFAFRFAGGALSQIASAATGFADKAGKSGFIKQRREFYGQKHKDNVTAARAEKFRNAEKIADDPTRSRFRRSLANRQVAALGGYKSDILDREAEINERTTKADAATTNNGDDTMQRAYTVQKELADRAMAKGEGEGVLWKKDAETGVVSYQTAGGAWVTGSQVDASRRKYGKRNIAQMQSSLAYEEKKAITQEQQDNIVNTFGNMADEMGLSENEAAGMWIGAGFANQDKNKQWKHARWSRDKETGKMKMASNGEKILTEFDENMGSYAASQQNADTFTTMAAAVNDAGVKSAAAKQAQEDLRTSKPASEWTELDHAVYNEHQKTIDASEAVFTKAARVANSLRSEQPVMGDDGQPTGAKTVVIGAGASGRTQEEMRAFVAMSDTHAGKYTEQAMPEATARPAPGPADSHNRRDQNIPEADRRRDQTKL